MVITKNGTRFVTKTDLVKRHLKDYGIISEHDALYHYQVKNLEAIVRNIHIPNHKIVKKIQTIANIYDEASQVYSFELIRTSKM